MELELTCKQEDEALLVDIDQLAQEYVEYKEQHPSDGTSITTFVDDWWAGQDDLYYYCTNSEENKAEVRQAIQDYLDKHHTQTEQTEVKPQTENRKVYIISYTSYEWAPMDITHVTNDPFKAKAIIKDIVLDHINLESNHPTSYGSTKEQRLAYLEKFAQDLVDGNTKDHDSYEFDNVRVWCDVREII